MKEVHLVVGVVAISANALAAAFGGWRWWRTESSVWFWRLLRAGQAVIIVQVLLGGVLVLMGQKPHSLHVLYGILPLLVAVIAEQLRGATAQMVLDARGYDSAQEVGRASAEEQRAVVAAIVRRELAVMALAALVNVVLLARAATTAG